MWKLQTKDEKIPGLWQTSKLMETRNNATIYFTEKNFQRTYAVRRIRDAFRENKNVKDPVEIQALVNKAKRDLGIIRRQIPLPLAYWDPKTIHPDVRRSQHHFSMDEKAPVIFAAAR
ncbi:hypothetical protein GH733_016676 [Mirounga leonina]|nr:hypothetical protein GH733_016676 [Mirounga leonina]